MTNTKEFYHIFTNEKLEALHIVKGTVKEAKESFALIASLHEIETDKVTQRILMDEESMLETLSKIGTQNVRLSNLRKAISFIRGLNARITETSKAPIVGVFSWGGIVSHVEPYKNIEEGIKKMDEFCIENRFDYEVDDARIFEVGKDEGAIHSFDHTKYLEAGVL